MQHHHPALFAVALAASSLPAQYQTLTAQSIGAGCNIGSTGCCDVVGMPTVLAPTLDTTTNRLLFTIDALEGCCGVTVQLRALALGTQQVLVPLPEFGSLCSLHVAPIVLLAATGNPFVVLLPPSGPPVTLLAQGAAFITDPWTPGVMTLTGGLAITLQ